MKLELLHRLADEPRLVLSEFDFDVRRQRLDNLSQPFLDGVGDGNGVRSRLFLHEKADTIQAVEAGEASGLLDSVLHPGDIAHTNGVTLALGHDEVGKLGGFLHSSQGAQHQLALPLIDNAARHLEVLVGQRKANILNRKSVGGKLVGIDNHIDGPAPVARHEDCAHARNGLQPFDDLKAGDLGDITHGPTA